MLVPHDSKLIFCPLDVSFIARLIHAVSYDLEAYILSTRCLDYRAPDAVPTTQKFILCPLDVSSIAHLMHAVPHDSEAYYERASERAIPL